jgi:assimilatory nitrate reductase catalytic subunit
VGEARADWRIVVDVAQRVQALLPQHAGRAPLLDYGSAEAVWNAHRESTRGRDLDITGLSYAQLERSPTQWPCLEAGAAVPRLYTDARFATPDGRARLQAPAYQGVAEPCDARYPLALNTGRLRDQWHGMSRTGTVARLFGHSPTPQLQLHPQDAQRLALQDGDLAYVTSRRGTIVMPVAHSDTVALGQVFAPMHWGDEFLSGSASTGKRLAGVNAVSSPALCPQSRQPELKHAAVKVLKAELPWSLWAMAWLPPEQVHTARAALQECLASFAFASCTLIGGSDKDGGSGVLVQASGHQAPAPELLAPIEHWLGLAGAQVQRYSDPRRGQWRRALLVDAGDSVRLQAVLLAGDTRARQWIAPLVQDRLPAHSYTRALMVPGAQPPVAVPQRGPSVCACMDVGERAITQHLQTCAGSAQERLASLQSALRCGTNCGSCVPQLQRMVRASMG